MKRHIFLTFALIFTICVGINAQVPLNTLVQITKAEDARRYDSVLETLLKSPNAAIRERAALAAGRIDDKRAIPALAALFEDTKNVGRVWTAAVFALGEIESADGGEAVLNVLKAESGYAKRDKDLLSRAIEAAGKIVAANAKDPKLADLKSAIVRVLNDELESKARIREVVLGGLTAILRARPDGGDAIVAKFLTDPDARIRTDAANTLTRLRAKNANEALRKMLVSEPDGAARANVARALGAAEDKDAVEPLVKAAMSDPDSRVRVSAIRALGGLKDTRAAIKLIQHGTTLLGQRENSKFYRPVENSELLEIATALGRLIPGTEDKDAIKFFVRLRIVDGYESSETEVGYARVAPKAYFEEVFAEPFQYSSPNSAVAYGQGMAEIASAKNDELTAQAGEKLTRFVSGMATGVEAKDQAKMLRAMPDLTRSMAALKPDNLDEILRRQLENDDVFIRTAAAELLAERPRTDENIEAIGSMFIRAYRSDKHENDAQLAALDALAKLDKKGGLGTFLAALATPDYLVRKKAAEILADPELQKEFPGIKVHLETLRTKKRDNVLPYSAASGTKLGQLLNSDLDYRRALSRKNGSVKAVLTTEKGAFTIVFNPEEAPLTVDNWVKLARSGYFNGLEVHRVVPNFVMQDGDPRGDGNGGPGWSIRCEVNMLGYDRGAVGMALSGKDTGGSQWFVTHSPQPHLDGGYTVFGHVDEAGMKVVDNIVRGDKILTVKIIGK